MTPTPVTHYELDAHMQRVNGLFASIDTRLARIEVRLDARPAQRWLAGRMTMLVDRVLPLVLVAAAAFAAARIF